MKRSSMIPLSVLALALVVAALALTGSVADAQQAKSVHPLSDFGPLDSPANIQATLTVSKETGRLQFAGGGVSTHGPVTAVTGLSADEQPANNLRGKIVPVAAAANSIRIRFPHPVSDGNYAVFLEQSWLTNRAVSDKGGEGFTVTFSDPAPEKATLDWMIVR